MLLCGNSAIRLLAGGITVQVGSQSRLGHIVGVAKSLWEAARPSPVPAPPPVPRSSSLLGLSSRQGLRGGAWAALFRLWPTAAPSFRLCVSWPGRDPREVCGTTCGAADPLWTTPFLPLPIGSPSREQRAKAERGPGSPSGDGVVVLAGEVVSFQGEPECRACTPREGCPG